LQVLTPSRAAAHDRCLCGAHAHSGSIGGAESILIFGPGEAKGELKKRLQRRNLGGRIAVLETVDKMTDRQIAAKVRQHFAE
jgi:hypothetical protein